MLLISFINLFTFPVVSTGIKKGRVTLMWRLDVAVRYFEEIFQELKKKQEQSKKDERACLA